MQTPYICVKKPNCRHTEIKIKDRTACHFDVGDFTLTLFPPNDLIEEVLCRVHVDVEAEKLYYEDGFMIEYPRPYIKEAKDKLDQFDMPSHELDGFFSRVVINKGTCKIDGSATYLQTLFSYQDEDFVLFTNSIFLAESFLIENGIELEIDDLFLASHIINHSLAFYQFVDGPYKGLRIHDSVETVMMKKTVTTEMENKFNLVARSKQDRQTRINLLHDRLTHLVDEYMRYLDYEEIGHDFTGGRDSRTSALLFLQNNKEKFRVNTAGLPHIQDKQISNMFCKALGIEPIKAEQITVTSFFKYDKAKDFSNTEKLFIPFFKTVSRATKYNKKFSANGYLGNVLASSPLKRNQIIVDNKFGLTEETQIELDAIYEEKLAAIRSVYGDACFNIFNLMYNTTNKVSSVFRRLKMATLSVFETDIFLASYLLEDEADRNASSLHYELMKRSNPTMLQLIPFEAAKSFYHTQDTFELQLTEMRTSNVLYRKFIDANWSIVWDFLKEHISKLSYMDADKFLSTVKPHVNKECPAQVANKIYAVLGALELKGTSLQGYEIVSNEGQTIEYDDDFFNLLSMKNQVFVSGLSGMTYSSDVRFACYHQPPNGTNLQIRVLNVVENDVLDLTIVEKNNVRYVTTKLPKPGKYRVAIFEVDKETKKREMVFATLLNYRECP